MIPQVVCFKGYFFANFVGGVQKHQNLKSYEISYKKMGKA